ATFGAAESALRQLARIDQHGFRWAAGRADRFGRWRRRIGTQLAGQDGLPGVAGQAQLVGRIGGVKAAFGGGVKVGHGVHGWHLPLTSILSPRGEEAGAVQTTRRAALASSERSIWTCSRYSSSSPVTYSPEKHEVSKWVSFSLPSCTARSRSLRSW